MIKESDQKIQEIQILEQNLQNLMIQKQSFQMEINENQNALKELETSGEEVYKIIGQLMIKTDKEKIKEELSSKEKILNLRIKTLGKQEDTISERIEKLRNEIMGSIKP